MKRSRATGRSSARRAGRESRCGGCSVTRRGRRIRTRKRSCSGSISSPGRRSFASSSGRRVVAAGERLRLSPGHVRSDARRDPAAGDGAADERRGRRHPAAVARHARRRHVSADRWPARVDRERYRRPGHSFGLGYQLSSPTCPDSARRRSATPAPVAASASPTRPRTRSRRRDEVDAKVPAYPPLRAGPGEGLVMLGSGNSSPPSAAAAWHGMGCKSFRFLTGALSARWTWMDSCGHLWTPNAE
jgi:hypothetical protein